MALSHNTDICIKSEVNNKYLRFQKGTTTAYGLLEFKADNLFDPLSQFEVVKTDNSDLIHLKSRYNNKYLVRWAPDSNWISASADFPVDDTSSWACTFFKTIVIQEDGDTKKLQFQHVQLGYYLTVGAAPYANYLYADPTKRDTFTVTDWDSVLRIKKPRKVAFKGDDGNYLGLIIHNGRPVLQFSIKDPKDPKAAHEIIPAATDGTLFVKSTYTGKYWRVDKNDSAKLVVDVKNPLTTFNFLPLFRFNVPDINRIAFLSASNAQFCRRYDVPTQGFPNLIAANFSDVIHISSFVMVDLE